VTRLILLIILGLVAAFYFEDSRLFILDKAEPVLQPVFVWQTKGELDRVVRDLKNYESANFDRLPSRRQWTGWLEGMYHGGEAMEDSWGSVYFMEEQADSFFVVSFGPDREIGTEDDIRRGGVKARQGRSP
jgi:hypothetical protein